MRHALLLVGAAALLGACGRKGAVTDSANSVNTAPPAAATAPGTGDSMAMSPGPPSGASAGATTGASTGAAMPNTTSTADTTRRRSTKP